VKYWYFRHFVTAGNVLLLLMWPELRSYTVSVLLLLQECDSAEITIKLRHRFSHASSVFFVSRCLINF